MQIVFTCRRLLVLAAIAVSVAACVADPGVGTPSSNLSQATAADQARPTNEIVEEGSAGDVGEGAEQRAPAARPASGGVQIATASTIPPPRRGSPVYRCDGGRSMVVENRRSSVTLTDPDGETMVLPASPAGQSSRYGQKRYALVLDGSEALYVKPRQAPYTCRR